MRGTSLLLLSLFLVLVINVQGQNLLGELGKLAKKEGTKKTAKDNLALDSADFQFAISVNENAGFFDVQQKGELMNKGANFFLGTTDEQKTPVDMARQTIKAGIDQYEVWKNYAKAETFF